MDENSDGTTYFANRVLQIEGLLDLRRYDDALPLITDLVFRYPDEPDAHCLLAAACERTGRYTEGLRAANRALELHPENEWALRLRAHTLLCLRQPKEARLAALEVVRLEPELALGWDCLAQCELLLGRLAAARTAAERYRELDPESADPYCRLAQIELDSRKLGEAERYSRKALELEPNELIGFCHLGTSLSRQGRHQEAIEVLYQGMRVDPGDLSIRHALLRAIDTYIDPTTGPLLLLGCVLALWSPLLAFGKDRCEALEKQRRLESLPTEIQRFYNEQRRRHS